MAEAEREPAVDGAEMNARGLGAYVEAVVGALVDRLEEERAAHLGVAAAWETIARLNYALIADMEAAREDVAREKAQNRRLTEERDRAVAELTETRGRVRALEEERQARGGVRA